MELDKLLLIALLSWAVGAMMGYLSRDGVEKDEAYKQHQDFYEQVMSEAKKYGPEEAARVGEIMAKRMADDILKEWYGRRH